MKSPLFTGVACIVTVFSALVAFAAEDILIADFEGEDYGRWTTTGDAFDAGPLPGAVGLQKEVTGFMGKGLVNTFLPKQDL